MLPYENEQGRYPRAERVFCLSDCLSDVFPGLDFFKWNDKKNRLEAKEEWQKKLGLDEAQSAQLLSDLNVLSEKKHLEYPADFCDLSGCKAIWEKYVPKTVPWKILGFGVAKAKLEKLKADLKSWDNLSAQYAKHNPTETLAKPARIVNAKLAMPTNGKVLGHDITTLQLGVVDSSYLWSYSEKETQAKFGVNLNQFGLVDVLADANKMETFFDAEEEETAEGPWHSLMVVDYTH